MKQTKFYLNKRVPFLKLGIIISSLFYTLGINASKLNFTNQEKVICYSLNAVDSTVTFLFDELTWNNDLGGLSVNSVNVRGSFNLWTSTSDYLMTRDPAGFWYLTKKFTDIKQPGNSGQPEFKFYINGSKYMDGARAFVPVGYIFMNSDKNHIVVFPNNDFDLIKANSIAANQIKSVTDFDLTSTIGKEEISNFRQVPGGTKLFRSYHPFKTSNATAYNTEDERMNLGAELATSAGIQSDICLSGNEINTLTSYTMPDGSKYTETIPPYYQTIINNGNVLYVGQTSTTPSYNAVYYQSDGSVFGNWIKETVQFIISDSHLAPFLIHCRLGTDRTGVFCAVLAALEGASWDEIATDFQLSNRVGIKQFRDFHILKYSLEKMLSVSDIDKVSDLKSVTSNYFISKGYLTQNEINALNTKLGSISSKIEDTFSSTLSLYPNPASKYIMLLSDNLISQISIYHLDGRTVMQTNWNNKPIYVGQLEPGIYLVETETGKNKTILKLLIK